MSPARRRLAAAAAPAMAVLTVALLALAGCAGKPPEISRVFAQPIFVHDLAAKSDWVRLGVFVVATDPDGQDDLDSLYVINDAAELYWKIGKDAWVSATAEGEPWIGTNTFTVPGGAPPPAGEYRVVLQDLAGETVEDTFTLPRMDFPSAGAYPGAAIGAEEVAVSGGGDTTQLWIVGKDGKQVGSVPVPKETRRVPLAQVHQAGGASGSSLWVYTLDRGRLFGLLAGPYKVP